MPDSSMQKKSVLITGGGTGIGAACARLFAASGAAVTVMGRRKGPVRQTAQEIGGLALTGDAACEADCLRAVTETVAAYGGLNALVCCAGIMSEGSVTAMQISEWERIIQTNLTGVMQISRAALPFLRRQAGASIVVVASLGALVAPGEMAGYVASKTALLGLTRSMAVDFGPAVRVNTLCPGWVLTPMSEEEMASYAKKKNISRQDAIAYATRYLPLRRMAQPEEIARCVAFLASEDASFVTGAALVADGGSSAVDVGYISLLS